jgi:hypothetical protein
MIDIQKLLAGMGIKVEHKDPFMEASETPIEAMMTDMQERGLLTDELIEFMTPYLELERMHISLAFDEGTAAAAMLPDQLPPEDGIAYFGQVYT